MTLLCACVRVCACVCVFVNYGWCVLFAATFACAALCVKAQVKTDDNQGRYYFRLFHQSKQACSSKQTLIFKSEASKPVAEAGRRER